MSASRTTLAIGLVATLLLAGCGKEDGGGNASSANSSGGGGGAGAGGRGGQGGGPAEVGFVTVQATDAPVTAELSGRTSAYEASDVRPQVSGIIRRRYFIEGALVRRGQPLYEIDPSLYRAAVAQAQANLSSAQANAEATRIQAQRYAPLARIEAVSKQEYTNAIAQARQGSATVAQNRAALDTARINLRFTTVPAPISGRIGRSLFTVGALVNAAQADPLAQIQRLDPMFVDIQQSSSAMLALRRSLAQGGVAPGSAAVRLKLEDGSTYPLTGRIEFAEALVSTTTGTVTLRARFPNPDGMLLPGMFVRASFVAAVDRTAFLVPQQGVTHDPQGNATVLLVGPDNKVAQRKVTAGRTQGQYWVVTDGLKPGDRVIVQGTAKLLPGAAIRPVPATTPQRVAPPKPGQEPKAGGGGGGSRGG
ncbi:efflux RND transporter periplasmic adaptor subunit [Sphingomonas sp.]|uniref:efflux RND transporter periplasmic adaptor subunit n=1 Tax=Sphingomonas sp. TaxID=28214 RepID=UPI003AFFD5FF